MKKTKVCAGCYTPWVRADTKVALTGKPRDKVGDANCLCTKYGMRLWKEMDNEKVA